MALLKALPRPALRAVTWRVPARVLEQLELRWFDAELREGRPEHKTCRNPLSDAAFGGYRA